MSTKPPKGVTAIYVYKDRVLATASDFATSRPGGFTVQEAQESRARHQLSVEVVRALASPALYENLGSYDCDQIVRKMGGSIHIAHIGHDE